MTPRTLDHVALWVTDRDSIVERATEQLGMHVIIHVQATQYGKKLLRII